MFNFLWVYVDFEPCLFSKFGEKYNPARLLGRWEYLTELFEIASFLYEMMFSKNYFQNGNHIWPTLFVKVEIKKLKLVIQMTLSPL